MPSCGIIGLPMVGKTTVYNLLTGARVKTSDYFSGKTEANVGMARVPDRRIDFLSNLYKPKKTTYAQIEVIDVPGLVRGASEGQGIGNAFLDTVRRVDALIHVVRSFESEVEHVEGSINPLRDVETVLYELLMADIEFVDKRITRINESKKKPPQAALEVAVLSKVLSHLEQELPFSSLDLSDTERETIMNYTFLTDKPIIVVVNLDDKQLSLGSYPGRTELHAYCAKSGISLLEISANSEMEIGDLEGEERDLFFAELCITEPGIDRIAQAAYHVLGLISFFTVGDDEVRAWTIRSGTTARSAAGKIHSDLERGFIRAELMKYEQLKEHGSAQKLKEKGLVSLEGKDYLVEDGDILSIRFNV
jgi:GTP-binding protein YchF